MLLKKRIASLVIALVFVGATFATDFKLPNNESSKVRTAPKMTGVNYMNALNSVKLLNVTGTVATLTTTLDKIGIVKNNFKKNTFTVTVGYTSCKVKQYVNRTELPKTVTVDLTKVNCIGKKKPVNFLPLLAKGQRVNVFFAKQNWATHDTVITIQ